MNRRTATVIFIICTILMAAFPVTYANAAETVAVPADQVAAEGYEPVLYVEYNGTYVSLDKEGNVCAESVSKPNDLSVLTGIEFTKLTYGQKAVTETPAALEYAIEAEQLFTRYSINVTSMNVENSQLTVKVNNLVIKMGKNYNTERKINDLADFIDQIIDQSGTLSMQNENADKYGYSFRAG